MKTSRLFMPVLLVFLILNGIFIGFKDLLERNGFDQSYLIVSNLLLFAVSLLGFVLQRRGLKATNPHAFVRSVYMSMILKLLVCMIAVVVYVSYVGNNVNKPSLFFSMGLYLLYTTLEVMALMKSASKKNG